MRRVPGFILIKLLGEMPDTGDIEEFKARIDERMSG
jgi:hypothetical protein